jgi:hypothetical protein
VRTASPISSASCAAKNGKLWALRALYYVRVSVSFVERDITAQMGDLAASLRHARIP